MPNSRPRVVFNDKGICNACENGNEKISIEEEEISPVTEEIIAEFQNNRTKLLTKDDNSKIPIMEYVRENGEMVPDTWNQNDIDSLNLEFSIYNFSYTYII